MNYSHLLTTSIPQIEKLSQFGFSKNEDNFVYKKEIANGEFYVLIYLTKEKMTAEVFETETNEKYALFDVLKANGSFVTQIREEVNKEIEEIKQNCFETIDVKSKYDEFLQTNFNVKPDFPWADTPDYAVYRCKNQKWFALVMNISFKQLGFQSEEKVWVVNIKADSQKIPNLIDNKSIFPAYHMNKKYWITILLTAVTDFEKLCELTRESFRVVEKK